MLRAFKNIVIACVILWAMGFAVFTGSSTLHFLPHDAEMAPQEAIIVFTGGGNRVATGLNFLIAKKAPILFVSGVAVKTSLKDLIEKAGLTLDRVPCCVELGKMAGDTIGNAIETASWMEEKNLNNMILVTSSFHMRRALLELKIRAPHLRVTPYAVESDSPRSWANWRHSYVWKFHLAEYHKYLYALLRYFLKT